MHFNYGWSEDSTLPGAPYARHRHEMIYARPSIEVVSEPPRLTRPFEKPDVLTDRIFRYTPSALTDPWLIPAQRADLQRRQIDLLLEQLGARHAINYQIYKEIEYEECQVRAKLHELQDRPIGFGREGRFESELIKELQGLRKERHAESVACWRDASRILTDICEFWRDYADESRKARLMDDGI